MTWLTPQRIERALDGGAAALFAAALAFMLIQSGAVAPIAVAAALPGFLGVRRMLQAVEPRAPDFQLAEFAVQPIECEEPDELTLTSEDRLGTSGRPAGELLLEDALSGAGPDSRVVRLFDPAAMPQPPQPADGRHAPEGFSRAAAPDASQDLYQALAKLRSSLR